MRQVLQRLASVVQLTRVTGAFAAVANVWFVVVWTRSFAEEQGTPEIVEPPLWVPLAGSAVTALGLFAFGATLNDVIDAKRDRRLRPDRPLASERVSIELAMGLAIGTLLVAVLGSLTLGESATLLTVLVAIAVTGYNVAGRFIPALGLPLLSVVYAGHMLVPNVQLVFTWPVLLVLGHALVIGLVSHIVSGRTPRLSVRAIAFTVAGWAGCSALLLWIGPSRGLGGGVWPEWVPLSVLIWIGASVTVLIFMCARRLARLGSGRRAAEKIQRYGTLWPAVYACVWMVGSGELSGAWPLLTLAMAGVLGMTILREAYSLVEEPIEFTW
ncbi:MAG: UbiA family prenyltransferase [Planctomycetota bacterium]